MNHKTTISLQRWLYVRGNSIPASIRNLADEIEKFKASEDEHKVCFDETNYCIVEISYDEDIEEYRSGICVSWKKREYFDKL